MAHPVASNVPAYREALIMSGGVVSAAARHLGIRRKDLEDHIVAFPLLSQTITDLQDTVIDMAESYLVKGVYAGDLKCIDRVLEGPWGQKRGWGPKASQVNVAVMQQDQQLKIALADMPLDHMRAIVDAVATVEGEGK